MGPLVGQGIRERARRGGSVVGDLPAMCFVIQSASAGTAGSWDPEWSPCAHATATRAAGRNERILAESRDRRLER